MFTARRNRNMFEAALTTLALIYHITVHNLRKDHRSPIFGLVTSIVQSALLTVGFLGMYLLIGVKSSPIRGDFILYILSGVFLFITHSQTAGAVSGAGNSLDAMTKHGPINTAVLISGAALAVLYRQTLAIIIILWTYNTLISPIHIDQPLPAYGMLLMAWFYGICIGLIFLSVRMWWPSAGKVLTQFYQRLNMIASGKMFVANTLPGFMLYLFAWNPLFHLIDQTRGFVFINYSPHNTNLTYPTYAIITVLMVGLMAEFVTRNAASLSWSAGR